MRLLKTAMKLVTRENPNRNIFLILYDHEEQTRDYDEYVFYKNPISVTAQVQPLTTGDIRFDQSIEQQGDYRNIWITQPIYGINRPLQKGGDFFFFDGSMWKVIEVAEDWGHNEHRTCKVARQIPFHMSKDAQAPKTNFNDIEKSLRNATN